jgi:hypothetical protein
MVESIQKRARKKELLRRLGIQFQEMVTTEPSTNEVSLSRAAQEIGVDFGLLLRAAANFDLSPINVRETKTAQTRTSDERSKLSACVSRVTLKQWFKRCREKAEAEGMGVEDYLRRRYFWITIPVRHEKPEADDIEGKMEERGLGRMFRSAISRGEIAMVDGKVDPVSVARWEKDLMKMPNTINLNGDFSIAEVLVIVPDIERKTLEGACTQGRLAGAKQEAKGKPWSIPATGLARWYNEIYKKRGTDKEFIVVTGDDVTEDATKAAKDGILPVSGNPQIVKVQATKLSTEAPKKTVKASVSVKDDAQDEEPTEIQMLQEILTVVREILCRLS